MNIDTYLLERQQRINSFLSTILPSPERTPQHLHEAMHYAVLNGGKRMRPLLVYATGEAFGVDLNLLDYPACAVELIHAYSLVHDDLPAMDDDDLRRGKPTCHKAFDEATAILVGDALQALAFKVLADNEQISPTLRLNMVSHLAKASGSLGMAGGQALDLKATGETLNQSQLQEIHSLKTGALIKASVQLGLLATDIQDKAETEPLKHFASHIGLCFQIQDDILNAEGSMLYLGKKVGTDEKKQKITYTTLNGVSQAKQALQHYYHKAITCLNQQGEQFSLLRGLADYIIHRNH